MEIHNISEDIVFNSIHKMFSAIKEKDRSDKLCLCDQCRLDTACYVLNRIEPRYIVSNRGVTRFDQDWAGRQQVEADIASLVYKGLKQVNHNQRPNVLHDDSVTMGTNDVGPVFDMPTIVGRLFDGGTFAPLAGITVELRSNGELVSMRNANWQNPFTLITNTPGSYTFWPASVPADAINVHRTFEFSIKIESSQYETMTHFFKIPAVSGIQSPYSRSLDRTFKLPDLYLFHPGDAEVNG